MAQTLSQVETFTIMNCGKCGVAFALADSFIEQRREDHQTWHCPNGHGRYYSGKNKEEQLRRELAEKQGTIEWYEKRNTDLHTKLTQQKHSNRALKAAKTKIMNRVKNGVCPCCNRTFQNLQSHFKSVHPELVEATS